MITGQLVCARLLGDKTPAKEHAAVWVPDSDAQFCMHCLKAKFTTMNRRVCTSVVCSYSKPQANISKTCFNLLFNTLILSFFSKGQSDAQSLVQQEQQKLESVPAANLPVVPTAGSQPALLPVQTEQASSDSTQ